MTAGLLRHRAKHWDAQTIPTKTDLYHWGKPGPNRHGGETRGTAFFPKRHDLGSDENKAGFVICAIPFGRSALMASPRHAYAEALATFKTAVGRLESAELSPARMFRGSCNHRPQRRRAEIPGQSDCLHQLQRDDQPGVRRQQVASGVTGSSWAPWTAHYCPGCTCTRQRRCCTGPGLRCSHWLFCGRPALCHRARRRPLRFRHLHLPRSHLRDPIQEQWSMPPCQGLANLRLGLGLVPPGQQSFRKRPDHSETARRMSLGPGIT